MSASSVKFSILIVIATIAWSSQPTDGQFKNLGISSVVPKNGILPNGQLKNLVSGISSFVPTNAINTALEAATGSASTGRSGILTYVELYSALLQCQFQLLDKSKPIIEDFWNVLRMMSKSNAASTNKGGN